jgi:CRP/FNR family transcriptional regulator, nitrogen fixation regulation protein
MLKPAEAYPLTASVRKSTLWSDFRYRRDTEIFGDAEPADFVYQIKTGAVRTFKLLPDGRRQIGAFHLPGDIFGVENADHYRSSADAIVDTRVRFARRERFFEESLKLGILSGREVLRLLTRSLEHAESHLLLLGRQNALEKVAAFLTEMDQRLQTPKIMILPMGRRDIADYLGLTHETVSRTFALLVRDGVLTFPGLSHREIVLCDRARLAQLALLPTA